MKKVLVAMSGGVDSSFTIWLLRSQGFYCEGATMVLSESSKSGANIAKQEALTSSSKHVVNDWSDEFKSCVVSQFVKLYEIGETPNPCVWCNKFFKFGKLLNYAIDRGFDYLATGHYARVEFSKNKNCFVLKRAIDNSKDQTYFLYFLNQQQLARVLFPIGSMTKSQVKKMAQSCGLESAYRQESQDVCFIGREGYVNFIKRFTGKTYDKGNFVDEAGNVLGVHEGIINYTVGQRKGLKLAFLEPYYVKEIKTKTNEVVLAPRRNLLMKKILLKSVNLIFLSELSKSIFVTVKLRYSVVEFKAEVRMLKMNEAVVKLEQPQIVPAKGQVVVFYDGDLVVGGGVVKACFT